MYQCGLSIGHPFGYIMYNYNYMYNFLYNLHIRLQYTRVSYGRSPANSRQCFPYTEVNSALLPPHIFEVGLKVNTKVYLDVLKSVVIPWYNQMGGGRPWVWQRDSALAYKSKETQACLQKECYDFVPLSHWPPPPPT